MPETKNIVDQSKYPAGQAPRGNGDTQIKATVFREREAMQKNDPNGDRLRPRPQGGRPS